MRLSPQSVWSKLGVLPKKYGGFITSEVSTLLPFSRSLSASNFWAKCKEKNTNSYICSVLLADKTQSIKMAGDVFF